MTRASLFLVLMTIAGLASSQETVYVSDEQRVPLRSGPSSEYRITHRGIPSGTAMVVNERSDDGTYSRITTVRGTEGWIRS